MADSRSTKPRKKFKDIEAENTRLACTYGYRMIVGLMRNADWQQATEDRVRRIWKEDDLKVPDKQHPRGCLWLNDGSCLRLRPEHRNHVWGYDFVLVRDIYGSKIRMLTMIYEYSRNCLTVHCARSIGANEVIEQLVNAMIMHGIPEHMRRYLPAKTRAVLAHLEQFMDKS